MADSARVVIWNVEWAGAKSERGQELARRIAAEVPDVVCLLEAPVDFELPAGHCITSDPDYGYVTTTPKRRKVLLWSRNPWFDVDLAPFSALPGGRFVRGRTEVSFGKLDFWGVCIPWNDAHVRNGRRDRKRWQDHLSFLAELEAMLREDRGDSRIVLGDYNQRVPRFRVPEDAAKALQSALGNLDLATSGIRDGQGKLLIDHLAHSTGLRAGEVRVLPREHQGPVLSDHVGLSLRVDRSAP